MTSRNTARATDSSKSRMPVRRALVVFSGQTELPWLRLLRPGFRHCFVLIESRGQDVLGADAEGGWVLYNPLSNATQIALWPLHDEETIRAWLAQQGYTVVETHVRPLMARVLPWRPFTCVEAVKRALGLHESGIFTPWQLYTLIKNDNEEKIILDYSGALGYKSS